MGGPSFGLALELQRNRGKFKQELLMRSRIFLFERRELNPHILTNSTNDSSSGVTFYPILRHGANYPQPDFKIRVHIKTRTGDLNVSVPFAFGNRQLYKLLSRVCNVFRFALLFPVDFRVGTKRPSLMSATGCTVLVLLTSSLTTSPVVLSTS